MTIRGILAMAYLPVSMEMMVTVYLFSIGRWPVVKPSGCLLPILAMDGSRVRRLALTTIANEMK